jgi:hypothetical protein
MILVLEWEQILQKKQKRKNNMNYKIHALSGFYLYFDQIISIFRTKYINNNLLSLEQLSNQTGINVRKVGSILNYLSEIGLSKKITLKGTELGNIIFENDTYLKNDGTLWLIHYLQSTNNYLVIWNRVMNQLILKNKFKKEEMLVLFEDLKDIVSDYTYKNHFRKEINTIIDAYINQGFSKLNIISNDNDIICVNKNHDVPNYIILASIVRYRDNNYPGATSININELCKNINSPGRIFLYDEHIFRKKIEDMKNHNLLNIESRGDLDQVRIMDGLKFEDIVKKYYIS